MIEAAVLIGIAGWRIASLLITEDGPFDIFMRIRDKIIGFGPVVGFFPKLFSCIWCMSVWTTGAMAITWLFIPEAVIVAAATGIAVIPELLGEHHRDTH